MMMDLVAGLPVAAQAVVAFLLGAFLASSANYFADRFGWRPRYRSPWRRLPAGVEAPVRSWAARIPIVGWLETARLRCGDESAVVRLVKSTCGGGKTLEKRPVVGAAFDFSTLPGWENRLFWLRPMIVEALFAAFLTWRFFFWAQVAAPNDALWGFGGANWAFELVFCWFALCITLVDFDDYIIPDAAVIPGATVGLALAALFPSAFGWRIDVLWPLELAGATTNDVFLFAAVCGEALGLGSSTGLVRGLVFGGIAAIWTFWNFALLERRFPARRLGVRKAAAIFCRRLRRSPLTPILATLWALGLIGIAVVVYRDSGAETFRLLEGNDALFPGRPTFLGGGTASSLAGAAFGLFVGATIIWAVRIIGRSALGVEAMGFGDVAAFGVIGAFVGWQGTVVAFFLAPFFGLVFGFLKRFSDKTPEIPYGPFLCGGAVLYLAFGGWFNAYLEPFFGDPLFLAGLAVVGFALLWALLTALRVAKSWARRG